LLDESLSSNFIDTWGFKRMSRMGSLLSTIRLPSPLEIIQDVQLWVKTQGLWWATSVTAHAVVLSGVLLFMGTVAAPLVEGDAPKFEAKLDTVVPETEIEHFEVGDTPIEPSELNTDTLSVAEAPKMAQAEQVNTTEADTFQEAGGGAAAESAVSFGGLGGFDVKAVGPGAKVRGPGGVGAGIGAGSSGGSGGAGHGFGNRGAGVRKALLGAYGGTKGSERAVAAALNWFARHQNPDGGWSLTNFGKQCKNGTCTGISEYGSWETAATSFALLPFFAAGQTHESKGPYKKNIYAGLSKLISMQKSDGDLRGPAGQMYTHGLSTICLCEAFGLTGDRQIGAAAQQAINFIVTAQDPAGGGWAYQPKVPGGDTSIVGWQVMGLKSGLMAGLSVPPKTLELAAKFLNSVGTGEGGFGYQEKAAPLATSAVGLLCMQYMGTPKNSPVIVGGVKLLGINSPDKNKNNCYYYYYGTQVMHNVPGREWDAWNRAMRRQLIESQIKEGCAAGSWKPDTDDWAKGYGGRIMVTSLNTLTLEVYYRYLPLYQIDGKKSDKQKAK
jgi:hypothetical protein